MMEQQSLTMDEKKQYELQLVLAAQKDPEKFKPLYDAYYTPIFRYILARVDHKEEALDLVSNTFYKAITNIKSYSDKGYYFKSWLYKIAHNELLLHYRDSKSKHTVSIDDKTILSLQEEIETPLVDKIPLLIKGFDYLDDEEMELLEMKYYEDLSHKEISEILDISVSNAKVKLHRVIQKLKNNILKSQTL